MTNISNNKNLNKAKDSKNDEFYTQLTDIEKELGHYKEYFNGKVVLCNCDDPQESNFWKYFSLNFEFLGLKKLISTHFETEKPSYKLEIIRDINNDGKINDLDTIKTSLKQNGDFRSPECIEILKESDIVVTNPPFSLFREYINQLVEYNKKFIIMGNNNAITYKEIFKLIKEERIWLGYSSNKTIEFGLSDSYTKWDRLDAKTGRKYGGVPAISWYTNLETKKRHENLILYKTYYGNEYEYPKYDNYDAININKVKNIPVDYNDTMGVPITFLDKHNPCQFEIIGNEYDLNIEKGRGYVNGKRMYSRIFIKRKGIK